MELTELAEQAEAEVKAEGQRLLAFTAEELALHRQRIAQVLVDLLFLAAGVLLGRLF